MRNMIWPGLLDRDYVTSTSASQSIPLPENCKSMQSTCSSQAQRA